VRHLRRLGGFGLVPAASILASLVLLPLISRRFGAAGWVALGLGQSIGAIVSVIVGMAWPVIGGNLVARASTDQDRISIFREAAHSRILILSLLLVGAIPITVVLTDHYALETVLFMVGVSLNGLTATWYFAGLGRPSHLVVNEGLVRLTGYLIALTGLLAGAGLAWYGAVMVTVGLMMFALNWWTVMRRSRFWLPGSIKLALRTIQRQLGGTVSRVLQAAFVFGGPTIFSLLAPAQLPLFAALDQVQKASNNALSFVPNAFVSWVGSAPRAERGKRMARSVAFILFLSVIIVIAWIPLGPRILGLLFAEQFTISASANLLLVLSVTTVLMCRSLELLIVVPLGRTRVVFVANSVISVVGLLLVMLGAVALGAVGGLGAWALSYGVLACLYVLVAVQGSAKSVAQA
jgi:O-antigen/teichoic acid export membrane protein